MINIMIGLFRSVYVNSAPIIEWEYRAELEDTVDRSTAHMLETQIRGTGDIPGAC